MQLPGLITVRPQDADLIERLSAMMGKSFLEELWTTAWLSALDGRGATEAHKLEISCAIMRSDFTVAAPLEGVHMLPDGEAAAGAYLKSELGGRTWSDLEIASFKLTAESVLEAEEIPLLVAQAERMRHITDIEWVEDAAAGEDFIHFFSIGVDAGKRGSGAFRRLLTPFLDFADEKRIDCFLECYSDRLEGVYGHFGFEAVRRLSDPAFDIVERCMVRRPQL